MAQLSQRISNPFWDEFAILLIVVLVPLAMFHTGISCKLSRLDDRVSNVHGVHVT